MPVGPRLDYADALIELLGRVDVEAIDYDPDGFDDRVQAVRQQLKPRRRAADSEEQGPAPRQLAVPFPLLPFVIFNTICIRYFL